MFNKHNINRDACQLKRGQAKKGCDWWWHSFTAYHKETGEPRAFYVEFFLCNPKFGKEEPIFGQLKENQEKGVRPSYLMVNVGSWGENPIQLHRFFGWKKIYIHYRRPFSISINDCYLNEVETRGSVKVTPEQVKAHPEWMSDAGEISWNLKIKKDIAFNVGYGAGALFRNMQLFEMFWHAEGMKTYFEGSIFLNGEEYVVRKEDCYGYADKNWGKDFTSPWVWLSSNNLTSKITGQKLNNSVFDIGGGRPKIGFLALNRKLLSAFYIEGKEYEFNFSKFWTNTRTKFNCYETEDQIVWHIEQRTWNNKVIVDITCEKKDMLLIDYEAPNGKKLHNRLWNGGTGKGTIKLYRKGKLGDEIYAENVGCEYGEYDKK